MQPREKELSRCVFPTWALHAGWLLSFSSSMFYFTSLPLLLLHFIKTIQSVLRFWCLWPRETCSAQRQKAAVSLSAWKRESAH